MSSDDPSARDARRAEIGQELGHGHYAPGALDEVTEPAADPVREAKVRDVGDPADVRVDPETLRDGGP